MKKFTAGIALGLTLGLAVSGFAAEITQYIAEKANFPILVNGKEFTTDKPIVTINNSTYLPLRAIGDALGVKVDWNSDLNRAEIGETPAEPSSTYSFSNPAPLGEAQVVKYESFLDKYTAEMTVKEIIRGEKAWEMLKEANSFNKEAKDGYEYILAKIKVKLLDIEDGKAYDLNGSVNISLVSGEGREYEYAMGTVPPDPSLNAKLYKGSETEGWEVYAVKKDDVTPKLAFGRKYDGTGGIWFKAYK